MSKNTENAHVIILAGCPNAYTLPTPILRAAEAARDAAPHVIAAREQRASLVRGPLLERPADEIATSIAATGKVPANFDGTLAAVEQDIRLADLRLEATALAAENLAVAARNELSVHAVDIVVSHLRPGLAETLTEVRAVAPAVAGIDVDGAEGILRAGKPLAEARARLAALADRPPVAGADDHRDRHA